MTNTVPPTTKTVSVACDDELDSTSNSNNGSPADVFSRDDTEARYEDGASAIPSTDGRDVPCRSSSDIAAGKQCPSSTPRASARKKNDALAPLQREALDTFIAAQNDEDVSVSEEPWSVLVQTMHQRRRHTSRRRRASHSPSSDGNVGIIDPVGGFDGSPAATANAVATDTADAAAHTAAATSQSVSDAQDGKGLFDDVDGFAGSAAVTANAAAHTAAATSQSVSDAQDGKRLFDDVDGFAGSAAVTANAAAHTAAATSRPVSDAQHGNRPFGNVDGSAGSAAANADAAAHTAAATSQLVSDAQDGKRLFDDVDTESNGALRGKPDSKKTKKETTKCRREKRQAQHVTNLFSSRDAGSSKRSALKPAGSAVPALPDAHQPPNIAEESDQLASKGTWCLRIHLFILTLVFLKLLDNGTDARQRIETAEEGATTPYNHTAAANVEALGNCSCYAHGYDDGGSYGGDTGETTFLYELRRDIFVALGAVFVTCTALALRGHRIDLQLAATKKQSTKKQSTALMAPASRRTTPSPDIATVLVNTPSRTHAALVTRGEGMTATGSFLSAVLAQLWAHAKVAVADAIKDALDPTLRDLAVPLHFVKVDLGNVPVRTSNMLIHRVEKEAAGMGCRLTRRQTGVQIDVDLEWDGNCDIQLQATLSKSAKTVFGVESVKVHGRMHFLLSPLTTELPVVGCLAYGFTNPPTIDLRFTGAVKNIGSLSFVQSVVSDIVQSSLASTLVLPNRMIMPLDLGSYDFFDTYRPPIGMVRLRVLDGRGFKALRKKILKDIPDIYCLLSLGASRSETPPFRTCTCYNNLNPSWQDESCDFILYDMDQKVYVEVFDEDKGPLDPDDKMGKADISVWDLFRQNGTCELELKLDGKKTGYYVTVAADLFHLSEQLQSLWSSSYTGKDRLCGLTTILVSRAFGVPIPRKDAATYVKVVYGEKSKHERVFFTGVVLDNPGIDALNPMFDSVFHVPLTAAMLPQESKDKASRDPPATVDVPSRRNSSAFPRALSKSINTMRRSMSRPFRVGKKDNLNRNDISFTLIDGEGGDGAVVHGELGTVKVTLDDLLGAHKHTITETRCVGNGGAKLEFRVILSGMQSETEKLAFARRPLIDAPQDDQVSMYGYTGDSNINIQLTAIRGRGFQIKKQRGGKKDDVPDVYIKFGLTSQRGQRPPVVWKTSTVKDDTMPRWNESKIFSDVHPITDKVSVNAYSQNHNTKDDFLGETKFSLELLLRKRVMEIELFGRSESSSFVMLRCVQLHDWCSDPPSN